MILVGRRRVALVTAVILGAQLALAANAVAAPPGKGGTWIPPNTPRPATQGVPRDPRAGAAGGAAPAQMAQYRTPHRTDPVPGVQTLSLAATAGVPARTLDQQERQHRGTTAAVDGAPVWVGGNADAPGLVRVEIARQDRAAQAHVDSGLLLSVSRADGATGAAPVRVQVAPDAFAGRFGGNYAQRLRLVQLPACALSTPDLPECQTRTPVPTTVEPGSGRLTTTVTTPAFATRLSSGTAVLAVDSAPDGSAGNYKATSLKPSDAWSMSGTGSFTYSYPIAAPPALGGNTPGITLAYSSASVDGMTASTNAQSDWVGSGWSYNPGYIERSYIPCKDDGVANSTDSCWGWGGQEVSVDVAGMSGGLVYDDSAHTWHLANENGAAIELRTGGSNGAYNGEYWVVTLQDGTRMYFGAGHLPSAEGGTGVDPASSSAWTQPVYCPKSGDPCYSSGTGTNSFASNMAYRWNLDYVVDPHGNTTTYSYGTETNYYARGSAHTNTQYVRGGYLKQINYGWRRSDVAGQASPVPAAQIVFTTAQRCKGSASECSSYGNLTKATAPDWPDTPFDQICADTGTCLNSGISYFSTVQLSQIQTLVNKGGTYKPVDTYALAHSFPDPNDGSSPSLWLDSITHTGNNATTAVSLPPVIFTGTQTMANRVPGSGTWPAYNHQRLDKITTETGEQITVTYANSTATIQACDQTPGASHLPSPTNNTMLCYQQYWQGQGQPAPVADWFQKWVVAKVVQHDPVIAGAKDMESHFSYVGDAAWHRDDAVTTKNAERTWNQFRGFGQVIKTTGAAPDPVTQTATTYLRGMHGDYTSQTGGSQKSVTVTTSTGDAVVDANQYADTALEMDTYTQAGGTVTAKEISLPWSAQTASHAETAQVGLPAKLAQFVNVGTSKRLTLLSTGAWRTVKRTDTFSATTGLLQQSDDQGDVSLLGTADSQETCSTTTYATPPAGSNAGMVGYAKRNLTVAGACATAPGAATTIADTQTYYDGNAAPGVITDVGNVTRVEDVDSYTGSTPAYAATVSDATFDPYGRPTSGTNARGLVSTTVYTPESGQLPTGITSTDTTFHLKTVTTMDQARQVPTKTVDPNDNATSEAYDGLGRVTGVWLPGRATTQSASIVCAYSVNGTVSPSFSSTRTLRDDATYAWAYTIYDALGRERQTQSVSLDGSNGSLVTDTFYDTHGWATKKTRPFYVTAFPSATLYPAADASVPGENVNTYDGQGRTTAVTLYALGQPQWTTTTAYPGGDRTDVTPPTGGTATSTFTDARGRTTALWSYTTATPDGNAAHASILTYGYFPDGKRSKVTAPGGRVWTYTYDLHGNPATATDPDSGTVTTHYSPAGDLLSGADARPKTITWTYDGLGRKSTQSDGGTLLAKWEYDTAPGGKGKLATSTAYVGGANGSAYVKAVTGYNNRGSITGTAVTIPAGPADEAKLAGTYTSSTSYKTITGLPSATTYNSDGGLPAETVTTQYNQNGVPTVVAGNSSMLTSVVVDPYGNHTTTTLGDMPNQVVKTTHYDTAGDRIIEQFIDRESASTHADDIVSLIDPAGRVTAIRDVQGGGAATDLQCFSYDQLGRLTEAWSDSGGTHTAAAPSVPNIGGCDHTAGSAANLGGPARYWQSYTYNAASNRATMTDHAQDGNAAHDVVRTGTYTADKLQSVLNDGPTDTTDSYSYDAAGNTTGRTIGGGPNQTVTYTPQDKTESVTDAVSGNKATYRYDADGALLLQRDKVGSSTKVTLYLGDEQLTLDIGTNTLSGLRSYHLSDGVTMVRSSAGALTYEFGNAQGTQGLSIDAGPAQTVSRRYFSPFGGTRGTVPGSWADDRAFLNQPADPASGLNLLGARNYDPLTGRFLQRDPVFEDDVNQIGGYAYAGNSPVTRSDPSGLRPDCTGDCLANWSAVQTEGRVLGAARKAAEDAIDNNPKAHCDVACARRRAAKARIADRDHFVAPFLAENPYLTETVLASGDEQQFVLEDVPLSAPFGNDVTSETFSSSTAVSQTAEWSESLGSTRELTAEIGATAGVTGSFGMSASAEESFTYTWSKGNERTLSNEYSVEPGQRAIIVPIVAVKWELVRVSGKDAYGNPVSYTKMRMNVQLLGPTAVPTKVGSIPTGGKSANDVGVSVLNHIK
ncbi:RHS repeat-associated core domain-containing protein [Dactylosporangium sp. CS-033363]|uniref:RHS repeat-associated core domain-containing protein n=1 Tax=Dactylosporangium sp. CS-033363 TaxID=3239935 RepID=UPI003D8F3C1F